MPKAAFNFDGDNAYYEALKTKVLADEAKKKAAVEGAERERRASLGLPENEKKSRKERRQERKADPNRQSFSERAANVFFNAGRPAKFEDWQGKRTGYDERYEQQGEGSKGK